MNSLSPPIFPDNTEVNGKMKMKCLNINGNNITEIVTGPKIVYRSGERSFLKSISIDGYRFTISYIDDLFQGETVECNLRKNGLDVIYVSLYPGGNTSISGESYNSVHGAERLGHPYWDVYKSWKSISFNIEADIQDGHMNLLNDTGLSLTFDFVLPPPSEHTLYSSFISDMKYISENAGAIKIIDGNGKNDNDLLDIANNNKPCLILNNSPPTTYLVSSSDVPGTIDHNYYVTNKMNNNLCTACEACHLRNQTLTLFCFINGVLSAGGIANDTGDLGTLGGCIKFKNRWILAWNQAPYLWITEPNVESPIGATFTSIYSTPFSRTSNPQKLTYLDEEVAVCSSGNTQTYVNIQGYSVCTDGTTWSAVKPTGITPFKLGTNYYAIGYENGKLYKTTDKYNTLTEIGDTGELHLWLISYTKTQGGSQGLNNKRAFIYSPQNENVVVVNEDGTFSKTSISGRKAGGFIFLNEPQSQGLNGKYLFLDSSSSDVFESTDGISNWTLNHNIKIPQTLGVEQLGTDVESADDSWFIMTKSGANIYESITYSSNVTMVLNNSSTSKPVFYRATSSVDIPVTTRSVRSFGAQGLCPMPFTDASLKARLSEPERWREVKPQSDEIRRINDRVDELENKLRKFGID